ncbi:hypothetical protein ABL78_5325 [Leptomonas seymouri]|uniref:Exosome-associated protein 3 n=1 Tax=Leptomonas seymouri TaxID=5684 RepID=A0A0N1I3M9_LEPSE|nr:hypothetical protein ABL78_5325 [Leptomonas seymouri]|eukprot:KPI85615.1 hypothetical protein ABL78_5325 [Leptomonas seymouri]
MDVDSEVEPTLREMAKRIAVMRSDLLPALRQLDEDTILSHYSVDEQARLYLSAAFTLALSLYSLDKVTHRQAVAGTAAASRLTGAGTRSRNAAPAAPSTTDTQLVLKIERITEYIKKLQELATLERNRKLGAAAVTVETADTDKSESGETRMAGKRRSRDAPPPATGASPSQASTTIPTKKAKTETETVDATAKNASIGEETLEDEFGDRQMFSVVSRVAGEAGTLVSRLLKQVMTPKTS